jgi:hypothetical protein
MKFFALLIPFLVLAMSACKTCPANDEITEVIITQLKGHFLCGGYEKMKEDITPIVMKQDYCSERFRTDKIVPLLPNMGSGAGYWSSKGMLCYMASEQIRGQYLKAKAFPLEWRCKNQPDEKRYILFMNFSCQQL